MEKRRLRSFYDSWLFEMIKREEQRQFTEGSKRRNFGKREGGSEDV
jgi:hypothetical protein